jgi:hypothetical protein
MTPPTTSEQLVGLVRLHSLCLLPLRRDHGSKAHTAVCAVYLYVWVLNLSPVSMLRLQADLSRPPSTPSMCMLLRNYQQIPGSFTTFAPILPTSRYAGMLFSSVKLNRHLLNRSVCARNHDSSLPASHKLLSGLTYCLV